jgi:hypothetical protein
VTVTPFIGGYVFEGNEFDLDPALTYGVRAGYNFTKNLGVEGYFNYILTETVMKWDPNGDNVRIGGYGIEGLYHFFPQSRVVPFLAVGIGGIHYDFQAAGNMNKLSVDYGAGVKLFQDLPHLFLSFFHPQLSFSTGDNLSPLRCLQRAISGQVYSGISVVSKLSTTES